MAQREPPISHTQTIHKVRTNDPCKLHILCTFDFLYVGTLQLHSFAYMLWYAPPLIRSMML